MVGRDAELHQPIRRRQPGRHVDLCVRALVFEDVLGRVEAGRARADDRDAQRVVRSQSNGRERGSGWARRSGGNRRGGGAVESVECAAGDIATQVKIRVSRSV